MVAAMFATFVNLLDILSNGGNPEKILSHIPKIYLCTKTLTLSDEMKLPSGRPCATEFVSGVGSEVCTFEPAVPLEGKVEIYMQTILNAQKKSIFETVKRSLVRYHEMPRPESPRIRQHRSHWILPRQRFSFLPSTMSERKRRR